MKIRCRLFVVFSILLFQLIKAGSFQNERRTRLNSSERDAYLSGINSEKIRFEGAMQKLQQLVQLKNKDILDLKAQLSDLYSQREVLLKDNEGALAEYRVIKAKSAQIQQVIKVLKSLNDLIKVAIDVSLQDETLGYIKKYLNAKKEDRVAIAKDLEKLSQGEVDPEQKEAIRSLQKTLHYYGLSLIGENDPKADQLVESSLEQLIGLASTESKTLIDFSDIIKATLNDFELKTKNEDVSLTAIESEALPDLKEINTLNEKITTKNKTIQAKKTYVETLEVQILKCRESIEALEKKIPLAPPSVEEVYYERVYHDFDGVSRR